MLALHTALAEPQSIRLIVLDPGHFHASLVQERMHPQIAPQVRVYAPEGPDLHEYLDRIRRFNTRADNPTHWEEKAYTNADFLDAMLREKAGNVVVIAGNNAHKMEYISRAIGAGLNVFADKPMAITPANFELLRAAFTAAADHRVLLYDIMTERFQVSNMLQRELARRPEIFGTLEPGTADDPAVVTESVHHFFKEVSGKPAIRPAWFFDVKQQGEAIPDVGTHLVDLVQWECFPDKILDWRKDIKVSSARRWPTTLTLEQFERATGLSGYPAFLTKDVNPKGELDVFQNGEANYTLLDTHVKVTARWDYEAPPGGGDTHYSMLHGTRANLIIRQGAEQRWQPTLYVENRSKDSAADFEKALRAAVAEISANAKLPGLEVRPAGSLWEIVVPDRLGTPHEGTFARVTENYLRYLGEGKLPDWEVPNMLAKYYTTTTAFQLSISGR